MEDESVFVVLMRVTVLF